MRRSILGKKKGDLNLSINAIVVLILAITMLGLGLGFMRNMFSKTTAQFGDVSKAMQEQVIEQLKSSGDRLGMDKTDISVKKGESKEIYYGIRNDLEGPASNREFRIEGATSAAPLLFCPTSLDGNTFTGDLTIKTFPTKRIAGSETAVQKMTVAVKSTATPTTHTCSLRVIDPSKPGEDYAKKDFYITVE